MSVLDFIRGLIFKKTNLEKRNMVFDWELAARLINYMKPYIAYEVLEDMPHETGKVIYQGGIPVKNTAVYSKTKRPMIVINSKDPVPCFKLISETDEIGSWTKEALKMLEGKI